MYMRHNDVYILAVTKSNANVMLSFQFMTQVRHQPCFLSQAVIDIGMMALDITAVTMCLTVESCCVYR